MTIGTLLHFEDFPVGEIIDYGDLEVTREMIVEFAAEFDPQPFHLSEAGAEGSLAGELIASGWHTVALVMRLNCDHFLLRTASQGAPGIEEVNWRKPVRPGDRLKIKRTTLSARASKSRPDVGLVEFKCEVFNHHDELVMDQRHFGMILRRDPAP